jgi:hypothetical protein
LSVPRSRTDPAKKTITIATQIKSIIGISRGLRRLTAADSMVEETPSRLCQDVVGAYKEVVKTSLQSIHSHSCFVQVGREALNCFQTLLA